jgi:hypothetical protein
MNPQSVFGRLRTILHRNRIVMKKAIIPWYLALITFHVAHIMEETWGHFWIMNKIYGTGVFLLLNWILFCIPVVLLYLVVLDKKAGYVASIIYSSLMVANGIGHNLATVVTGRYFHGFAGGFSGIGLILSGIPLILLLYRNMPDTKVR